KGFQITSAFPLINPTRFSHIKSYSYTNFWIDKSLYRIFILYTNIL
ncbi:unnamed protein product, partial [marine sediment metagenome]